MLSPQENLYLQDFWLFIVKVSCFYTSGDAVEKETIAHSLCLERTAARRQCVFLPRAPPPELTQYMTSNYASQKSPDAWHLCFQKHSPVFFVVSKEEEKKDSK